jgi:hypothetical protein
MPEASDPDEAAKEGLRMPEASDPDEAAKEGLRMPEASDPDEAASACLGLRRRLGPRVSPLQSGCP